MTCYLPPFSLPGILHSIDLGLRSYDSFVALGVSALTPPVPCSSYILCAICLLHLVCYPFEASHFLGCSRLWVTLLQGSGLLLLSLLPRDPFWRLCGGGRGPLSATTGSVPVWLRPPRPPSGTGSSTPAPASPAPPGGGVTSPDLCANRGGAPARLRGRGRERILLPRAAAERMRNACSGRRGEP